MKTIHTLRDKPDWVENQQAQDRVIHNASRPLRGHAVENSWQLPFVHGRHYAAIDEDAADAAAMAEYNEQMDAVRVVYVTEQEAYENAVGWYQEHRARIWKTIVEDGGPEQYRDQLIRSWLQRVNEGGS